jgi:hypothetical protein
VSRTIFEVTHKICVMVEFLPVNLGGSCKGQFRFTTNGRTCLALWLLSTAFATVSHTLKDTETEGH